MRHNCVIVYAFIAFTLLVRRHEEHLAVKIELWVVGMVICHGQDADCLPMPLPSQNPIISCLSKIQNGSTFLVLAYQGCPGKQAVRWVFLFMISLSLCFCQHFYEIILHLVHKWSLYVKMEVMVDILCPFAVSHKSVTCLLVTVLTQLQVLYYKFVTPVTHAAQMMSNRCTAC